MTTPPLSPLPKKHPAWMRLLVSGIILLVVLKTHSFWAAGLVNRFSLELVRLWPQEPVELVLESCTLSRETETLQQMKTWLENSKGRGSDAALRQGQLACLQGDVQSAQKAWHWADDSAPPHPVASLFLATTLFEQGQMIDTPLASGIGQYGFHRGLQAKRENDDSEAIKWYGFSLSYAPSINTANYLASMYRSQGDADQVNNLWTDLAQPEFSDLPVYWWARAKLAETDKEWLAAAGYYQQSAQQADSMYAYRAFVQAGKMWYRVEAYEQAKYPLQQALLLALDPEKFDINELEPYLWLGKGAHAQEEYEAALAYFEHALILNPTDSGTLYEKALTLDSLGRREEAINNLAEAITNHQTPPEHWKSLLENWKTCPINDMKSDC